MRSTDDEQQDSVLEFVLAMLMYICFGAGILLFANMAQHVYNWVF